MLKIGLTGGIGSGKSMVADYLSELGAAVVDTDVISHELTAAGGAAMSDIELAFGTDVISEDGSLNRDVMRKMAFEQPHIRKQLEEIIHPLIFHETLRQAMQAQGDYLLLVVPLLVESGRWQDRVDKICVVDCEPETQIQRVIKRNNLSVDAVQRIISAQATRSQRLNKADYVVSNGHRTTLENLKQQCLELHQDLCSLLND